MSIEKVHPTDEGKPPLIDANTKITDIRSGIWHFRMASESDNDMRNPREAFSAVLEIAGLFWLITRDIFSIAPYQFLLYILWQFISGMEELVLLDLSTRLLKKIETGIKTNEPDVHGIVIVLVSRLVFANLVHWVRWKREKMRSVLQRKVTNHFQVLLMKSNLHVDLASSQDPASKQETSAGHAWNSMDHLIRLLTSLLRSGGQVAFITNISHATGGPFFVLLSLSHPLLSPIMMPSMWSKICYGVTTSAAYVRIKAIEKFAADGALRQDIISGGLAGWIIDEHVRANRELGDIHANDAFEELGNIRRAPFTNAILECVEYSPMIFCALNAAITPSNFSVSSVAMLQQSSTQLRYSLANTMNHLKRAQRDLRALRNIYRSPNFVSAMDMGVLPYPPNSDGLSKGMSFKLRDVTFSYPGSQTKTPGLRNVSLSIKAGQIVVIVGANGSGKSTLIRILSRLYDPSSGSVLIDGRPAADYIVPDLRSAMALLSQDNKLYPLSLRENIALGDPDKAHDAALVAEAAQEGGAAELIAKLKDGMETVLQPIVPPFFINMSSNRDHILYKEVDALNKNIDISGGERQKVVASRSFMRFRSGKIRFVAVDEPSSALDAEAELQLFQNLIKIREGKTLVFVTHRFGHLTKYADQILCMKDGSVCESGSHHQLIQMNGEYAKLYKIQAGAFAESTA